MENNNEIQIQFVPIELLEYNEGQIPGVPENPRTREDTKQRNLEKSIEELPEHYCDVIINRWETLTGRKAVKIG